MILKLTSAPDISGRTTTIDLIDDLVRVQFQGDAGRVQAHVSRRSGEVGKIDIIGNAFVMTDAGQTIDKVFHPDMRK